MITKIGSFLRTMKWYEWVIFAEAALLILGGVLVAIDMGDIAIELIYLVLALFLWLYPARLARKCRKRGWKTVSTVIVTTIILGLGLIGIFIYSFMRSFKEPSGTSVIKRCGACGNPAPDSAKVGDVCAFCGALWGYNKIEE